MLSALIKMADDEDDTCKARQHKKELAILIIIIMVRECFNTRFKIYYFSYQSLTRICKVQPHEFVSIGTDIIGRLWPSRCVQQVQNHE